MIFTVEQELHEYCLDLCTGESYNCTTIKDQGGGQYVGHIAEQCFARFVMLTNNKFEMTGHSKLHYDFVINGLTFDVKAKMRTVRPQDHYECHVANTQKNFDCNYYVFASVYCEDGIAKECEFVGWMRKNEFWSESKDMAYGSKDAYGFVNKVSSKTIQIKDLKKIKELRKNLLFMERK